MTLTLDFSIFTQWMTHDILWRGRGGGGEGQQTFPQNCWKQESFGPSRESSLLTLSDTIVHTLFSLNSDKCADTTNTITFGGGMSWVQVELLVLIQYCSAIVKGIIAVCFDLTESQVSWPGKWTSHLYFGTRHGWLPMVTCVAMLYPQPTPLIRNSGYIPFKIALDASMWLNVYSYWPQGKVMFSNVSVCPQSASWILVHCSALLWPGRYASYSNAFLLWSIFTGTAWSPWIPILKEHFVFTQRTSTRTMIPIVSMAATPLTRLLFKRQLD